MSEDRVLLELMQEIVTAHRDNAAFAWDEVHRLWTLDTEYVQAEKFRAELKYQEGKRDVCDAILKSMRKALRSDD